MNYFMGEIPVEKYKNVSDNVEFGLIGTALMGGAALAGAGLATLGGHKIYKAYKHFRPKGTKTWNMTKPKKFTKRNLAIGAGSLAATGLASYAGSKLYKRYQEKRKKWWEL